MDAKQTWKSGGFSGMINVDILSPVGGRHGGIENVIRSWLERLSQDKFHIRVIHMTPGAEYLKGFHEIYNFEGPESLVDLDYYVDKYGQFVGAYGSPDICVATNWPLMSLAADLVKKMTGAHYRNVSWVHNNVAAYENAGYGGFGEMACADAHICINNQIRDGILRQQPDAKVYSVGNPVNMQEQSGAVKIPNLMAYVGRLEEVKRVDIILEAMYRAKSHWRLKIVGTGSLEEELKECVRYLKLEDDVEFYGWQERPWECCQDAVVSVYASEYEGYMLSAAEAMSCGMTVVSTPVDGLVDYLVPGVNGYLYDHEDAVRLAAILDMLWEGSLPLCDRQACRQSVEWYSMDKYIKRVEEALENQYNCCVVR